MPPISLLTRSGWQDTLPGQARHQILRTAVQFARHFHLFQFLLFRVKSAFSVTDRQTHLLNSAEKNWTAAVSYLEFYPPIDKPSSPVLGQRISLRAIDFRDKGILYQHLKAITDAHYRLLLSDKAFYIFVEMSSKLYSQYFAGGDIVTVRKPPGIVRAENSPSLTSS